MKITKKWIAASKTRNFALNDPLIDYLKYYNIKDINDKPKIINKIILKSKKFIKKTKKKISKKFSFTEYIGLFKIFLDLKKLFVLKEKIFP